MSAKCNQDLVLQLIVCKAKSTQHLQLTAEGRSHFRDTKGQTLGKVQRGHSALSSASSSISKVESTATLCSSLRDPFTVGAHPILAFQVQLVSICLGLCAWAPMMQPHWVWLHSDPAKLQPQFREWRETEAAQGSGDTGQQFVGQAVVLSFHLLFSYYFKIQKNLCFLRSTGILPIPPPPSSLFWP